MKNFFSLLIFTALIVSSSSCKNDNKDDVWREANSNAYLAITIKPQYRGLKTETGPTGVYYKIINSGNGTEYPLQTSEVKILYKLSFYDETVFDAGSSQNNEPIKVAVNGTLYGEQIPRGLSFALQNMVVGDKWEIWVPYYLGYGMNGLFNSYTYQTIIKGYTTLVYEIELVSITKYPK
jgi:FKBP-type peptidyl-prolyl cis-trans isomerase